MHSSHRGKIIVSREDVFKKETRDSIDSMNVYVDMTNKSLNDLRQEMESQKASLSYLLGQLSNKIDSIDDKCQKGMGDCLDYTQKITSGQHDSISRIESILSGRHQLLNDVSSLKQNIDQLNVEMNRYKTELRELLLQSVDSLEKRYDIFVQEIKNIPSPVAEIQKQIHEKLDIISLDGSNAILRSTNCEKHLNLIEKKIECIMLLIKKLDLNQQET